MFGDRPAKSIEELFLPHSLRRRVFDECDLTVRILLQNAGKDGIELGMNLEQALWTQVDVCVGVQSEIPTHPDVSLWKGPVIKRRQMCESDQLFRVTGLGSSRLEEIARNEVVHRRKTRCDGMPP